MFDQWLAGVCLLCITVLYCLSSWLSALPVLFWPSPTPPVPITWRPAGERWIKSTNQQISKSANQQIANGEWADSYQLSAISHLQSAIRWDARNAQAYRLLGRAYLAQGDLVAAAEALTRFTELRPDNPLGHIELAEVYEALVAELEAHTRYDFLAHLPEARIETAGL